MALSILKATLLVLSQTLAFCGKFVFIVEPMHPISSIEKFVCQNTTFTKAPRHCPMLIRLVWSFSAAL